jgi:hypothetical protein
VDEASPQWVELRSPEEAVTWYGNLEADPSGNLSGRFTVSTSGAWAAKWRKAFEENKADEKRFLSTQFATEYPQALFDSITFENKGELDKPLRVHFRCDIPNAALSANDFLYVRPVIDFYITENPLKALERQFPVSFVSPKKVQYVLVLKIPEGYEVEELPAPAHIVLPNEGGRLQFQCARQTDQEIQVVIKLQLAKTEFPPEEYPLLREFFELVADKTRLQLVLKKT